jgi:hypothetical protein
MFAGPENSVGKAALGSKDDLPRALLAHTEIVGDCEEWPTR